MAQNYVTGPAALFVDVGGFPLFLGHCERSPSIQIRPYFSPVFCDLAGQRVPIDQIFDGEEAVVSADLTRYNESVYLFLAARPTSLGVRGTNVPGDIGSLMLLEGNTFQLWITFPYAAKAVMAAPITATSGGPMPAGYRFKAAYLEGPDDLGPLGTTARRLRLNFHCLRSFSVNAAGPTFTLYDHNMAAVAGLVAA